MAVDSGVSIPAADPNATPITAGDPFELFDAWFKDAVAAEPGDPTAMGLATAGADGFPDMRIVLLKGVDGDTVPAQRGFVFYTNMGSEKARQIEENPRVTLCFYWKSLKRQVRIMGAAQPVSDAEADAYFATRPRQAQLGAWASYQSRPLEARQVLENRVEQFAMKFPDAVPRPHFWSGFRIIPQRMEFWRDRHFRLHDRFLFTRNAPGAPWMRNFLYP